MPRMVHLHRPLSQRVQRKVRAVDSRFLKRHIPKRQWVEISRDPFAIGLRRQHTAVPASGKAEALKRLDIKLQYDWVGRIDESHRDRGFEIGFVGVLKIPLAFGQLILPKTTVSDIALELTRVGRATACFFALGTAPAAERPDARPAL